MTCAYAQLVLRPTCSGEGSRAAEQVAWLPSLAISPSLWYTVSMKPIWLRVHHFPFVDGMVVWPAIFLKGTRWDTPTHRHEKYHWRQALRWWVLPWYLSYIPVALYYWLRYGDPWLSPFEQQAIAAESDPAYDLWGGPA